MILGRIMEQGSFQTKQEMRRHILDLIKSQKEEVALIKNRSIFEKFLALPVFVRAKSILFYVSCKGEVDTFAMMDKAIELGKKVAVPLVVKEEKKIIPVVIATTKELKTGTYGIPEPCKDNSFNRLRLQEIDLVVVPGVAFDRLGNRLGRGAGYYDRLILELPSNTPTVGLAYDLQIVSAIPSLEAHDKSVTFVLSNH